METKPFKTTAVGEWITKNAPNLINTIENFVPAPVKGTMDVLKNLIGLQPNLTPEQKDEFNKIAEAHEAMIIADVQNARDREIRITQATGKKDLVLMILAFFGVLAPVTLIMWIIIWKIDVTPLQAGFIGTIIGSYLTVYNYFFGSSSGSKAKQDTLDTIAKS